ncbi:hypothetical protein HAX54_020539 [Datura stramonium]|uniref:C2H2-type domain-containing protein n=1 Tax=Datura stramonium TaxID=4076 RepID=A0ABS8Y7M3_DATST|nr:hypothetical protein [Datura stramonium]
MIKIKEYYTMEAHQIHQEDHDDHHLNVVIKRRRTKRPRPPSPLSLAITTSSCSTVEGANSGGGSGSGELVDGHVANSSSLFNNCGGIIDDDQMVRNTNQEEEDMANCLILLAQGHNYQKSSHQSPTLDVYQCKTCNRSFPSFQALGGHRASHKKPKTLEEVKNSKPNIDHQQIENRSKLNDEDHVTTLSLQIPNNNSSSTNNNKNKNRVHECSICGAEFTSGQALGGHMRRHRPLPNSIAIASSHSHIEESHHEQQIKNARTFLSLDLNLPAPEDDHRPESSKFNFASKEQVIVFSASPLVDCHY